jgi:hypothetical protein
MYISPESRATRRWRRAMLGATGHVCLRSGVVDDGSILGQSL